MPAANKSYGHGLLREMQRAVWSVNASLPVASGRTMQEIYSQSLAANFVHAGDAWVAGAMAFVLGLSAPTV